MIKGFIIKNSTLNLDSNQSNSVSVGNGTWQWQLKDMMTAAASASDIDPLTTVRGSDFSRREPNFN
jgi:hypothetical protein